MQRRPHFLRREPSVGETAASRSRLRRTADPAPTSLASPSNDSSSLAPGSIEPGSIEPDSVAHTPAAQAPVARDESPPHPVQVILRIPDLAKPVVLAKTPTSPAYFPATLAQIPTIRPPKPASSGLSGARQARVQATLTSTSSSTQSHSPQPFSAAATIADSNVPVESAASSSAASSSAPPPPLASSAGPAAVDAPTPKAAATNRFWERMPEWQRLGLQAIVMTSAAVLVVALFAVWHRSSPVADEAPRKPTRRSPANKPVLSAPVLARKLSPRAESTSSPDEGEETYPTSAPAGSGERSTMPEVEATRERPEIEGESAPRDPSTAPPAYPSSPPSRFQYGPMDGGVAPAPNSQDSQSQAVDDRRGVETARLGNIAPLGTGNIR